jgi:hemolysin activation/secretion protein
LGVLLQYSDKDLYNNLVNGLSVETYNVQTAPITITFDRRDSFFGGGISYGSIKLTYGDLDKDDPIRRGSFTKLNWDISRLQSLPNGLSLFLRTSGQSTNENLDASEGFGLSGPASVRAYPTGDAFGDEGWLTQLELRYALGDYTPYVFYDHGKIYANARPDQVASPSPSQERAGVGLGLRYAHKQWAGDLAVAWVTDESTDFSAQGDNSDVRAWLMVSRKF